jgi:hypothetical protein
MSTYKIQAPDGNTYQIDGPPGASDDEVRAAVLAQHPDAGTPQSAYDRYTKAIGQYLPIGITESAASLASGAVAKTTSDLAGLGTVAGGMLGLTDADPGEVKSKVQNAMTYQPRTDLGKGINRVLSLPGQGLHAVGSFLGAGARSASDAVGLPAPIGAGLEGGITEGTEQLPALLGPAVGAAGRALGKVPPADLSAAEEQTLAETAAMGIRVTPEYAGRSGGAVGNVAQTGGSAAILQKQLSKYNAEGPVPAVIKQEIGIAPNRPLTQAAIDEVKGAYQQVYSAVKKTGNITADEAYIDAIRNLGTRSKAQIDAFGEASNPLVSDLRNRYLPRDINAQINLGPNRAGASTDASIDALLNPQRSFNPLDLSGQGSGYAGRPVAEVDPLTLSPRHGAPSFSPLDLSGAGGRIAGRPTAAIDPMTLSPRAGFNPIQLSGAATEEATMGARGADLLPNKAAAEPSIMTGRTPSMEPRPGAIRDMGPMGGVSGSSLSSSLDRLTMSPAAPVYRPFTAEALVNEIQDLRYDFRRGMRSEDPAVRSRALASQQAADAMEGLLERHLQQTNNPLAGVLPQARTMLAKIHSVEDGFNEATGTVDVKSIASDLDKGVPLTGGLKALALAYKAFPKVLQDSAKVSVAGGSFFDKAMQVGGVLHGNWKETAVGVARPLARARAASAGFQQNLINPQPNMFSRALQNPGLAGGVGLATEGGDNAELQQ